MILNLYHHGSRNVGDANSAPTLYWDFGEPVRRIGYREPIPGESSAIIVGGGVLPTEFDAGMLIDRPKILWGIGRTSPRLSKHHYQAGDFSCYDLVGLRDVIPEAGYAWVPCSSCMSPLFDRSYAPVHAKVVYDNPEKCPLLANGYPYLSNTVATMREAVAFLGSGETIVTSSYHGMYWGLLLGRRVVVVPFGAKFFGLDVAIAWATPDTWLKMEGIAHPGFLNRCREANQAFFIRVRKLLVHQA